MRTANSMTGMFVGCVMSLSASCVCAQDWPQWRGPNRDAKVTGFTAPKTWPKELSQKWKVTVGNGVATPALVGDKLYVFAREGGDEVIRCLDVSGGTEVWKDKYEAEPATGPAGRFPGPRSSPTVVEGKVVTLGVRGTLSCLDAASGKVLWRKDDFKGFWPTFFTSSSPIVVDGLCIAQVGGTEKGGRRDAKENGAIAAYDLASGDEKWKWSGGTPGYASPVVMNVGGTNLIVAETSNEIVALMAADGKLVWNTPFAPKGMGYNASTPVVDGQTIIYGGDTQRGEKAVKIDKEGDKFVTKELWSNSKNSPKYNTPVLKDGLLFGLTEGNQFYAITTDNGQTAWTAAAGPAPAGGPGGKAGPGEKGKGDFGGGKGGKGGRGMRGGMGGGQSGYGSIVDAGSVLLALTPSSELIVLEPTGKEFKQLAKYKVAATPTYAYPVVSGNRIFIKDQDSVTLWTVE